MNYHYILLPLVAALIGWGTNYLAIKMLFHPRKPIKILFLTLHGIFPKRQKQLAEKIGTLVGEELVSVDDLTSKLTSGNNQDEVLSIVEEKIDHFLDVKLVESMPMLQMIMSDQLKEKIKSTLMGEIETIMPEVIEKYTQKIGEDLDIKGMVEEKVVNFSIEKLEGILFAIMKKEFKFIEIVGAVIGFFIGVIQVFIVSLGN